MHPITKDGFRTGIFHRPKVIASLRRTNDDQGRGLKAWRMRTRLSSRCVDLVEPDVEDRSIAIRQKIAGAYSSHGKD